MLRLIAITAITAGVAMAECKAYLYQHFDFGGDKKLYTTGEYERVWSNDVVSSIKVVGDGCKAIVYQHFDFGGWSVELPAGSYDQDKLSSMGFKNDEMSSLKVVQECRTYLYQHFNFGGDSKLYTTGEYERVWSNDVVSSIKVVGDGCKAIVYQHFNFGGWSVELPAIPGSYNYDVLRSMGFKNDEMSSLKVIQGPTSDGSTTRRLSEMMEAKALEMIDAHAAPVNELMPPPPAF